MTRLWVDRIPLRDVPLRRDPESCTDGDRSMGTDADETWLPAGTDDQEHRADTTGD